MCTNQLNQSKLVLGSVHLSSQHYARFACFSRTAGFSELYLCSRVVLILGMPSLWCFKVVETPRPTRPHMLLSKPLQAPSISQWLA